MTKETLRSIERNNNYSNFFSLGCEYLPDLFYNTSTV